MATKRAAQLAELRALRAAGKTRLTTYEVEEAEQLYEEVDEEGYKKVVRSRLDQDDFIVDDNGEGYVDDGREEWDDERRYRYASSESEEDAPLRGKAAKRKREEDRENKEKNKNALDNYFKKNPIAKAPKAKPVSTAEDAAFMADLLGEVDTNVAGRRAEPRAVKMESRRKTRILSPPVEKRSERKLASTSESTLDTPRVTFADDYIPTGDDVAPMSDLPLQSSPVAKAVERKAHATIKVEEEEDDDLMEVAQAVGHSSVKSASVNMAGSRPAPKLKKTAYPTPDSSSPTRPPVNDVFDASALNNVASRLNVLSSPATDISTANVGKLKPQSALEEDGSLRMFWTDYTEVNGSLCLFGKVKDKTTDSFVSCFVKIDNILRKLYFLPREYRSRHGRDTEEEIAMGDVYEEMDTIMSKMGVTQHKAKPSTRKYAFELPDIPKEAEYLKVLYPYNKPALPVDIKGETFSHVFGTNTALFEQFVLWKNIMGPCWLNIEGAEFGAVSNASWCKLELGISNPKLINPIGNSENLDVPPLTLMSIALRTKFNTKDNKQEIIMASARVYENISLSDTSTPPEKLPCKTFTVMRPANEAFPAGFKLETEKHPGTVKLETTEQGLLSIFMAMLSKMDPDVVMGHKLDDIDFPILLNRMRERKTPGWHRIGRLKRSEWPKNMGKGGGSFFSERPLAAGRLLCDLGNDMGKSLMTKCQSWSLKEMCQLVLGDGNSRQEFDYEAALQTWANDRAGLMNFLRHCEMDTYFIAAISLKVQMLPLSKVLTNLAGNSWARTLSGTRAERNEYILLHEFTRNKYICPDKTWGKAKVKTEDDADGEDGADTKKKDKYKGGLVFEPEKGLYDKCILVMDFNSLYPSIIQEFNICFTTVDRSEISEEEEKVPEIPDAGEDQGILPRLIATLVNRRREVKKLMKDPNATPDELATWDIKQLALKLTANSMYGCLGYTRSRFYARPLAMLTTFKGREILRRTKDMAEARKLRVIYGDTDSVMINTNVDTIQDALKLGNEFKREVNESYKLLEIDIDNVFRRMLLHAKKKYAAINMVQIDGKYIEKLEVKGLDMRRREYCALSKETSSQLLNFLLSGEDPEIVIEKIHDYLRELSQKMREFTIPVPKYTIFTQLGKDPKEYPNANSMPSVQVALRLISKGKSVKAKDVMSFIITGDSHGSSETAAKNAFTPEEIRADPSLKPDIDYYLHKQILPPVERLCAPVSGTNITRLAECLGLDTSKYRLSPLSSTTTSEGLTISPLESQIPDSVRFKDCAAPLLRCRRCKHTAPFLGLGAPSGLRVGHDGIVCANAACAAVLEPHSVLAQLDAHVRQLVARYYAGWLQCDDAACGQRFRAMSVYGHRCLGPAGLAQGCMGKVQPEVGEKAVYTELVYLQSLFDVDKGKGRVKERGGDGEEQEKVGVLADFNREVMGAVKEGVGRWLEKNGRRWVAMDSLFKFAM